MNAPWKARRNRAGAGMTAQQAADLHEMLTATQRRATAVLDRLSLCRESVAGLAGSGPAWPPAAAADSPADMHVTSQS
jgi:hypothetical protein